MEHPRGYPLPRALRAGGIGADEIALHDIGGRVEHRRS